MVYATIRQAKDATGQVAGNGDVNGQLNGQLNDSQKETFEFIKAHEGYNTTKIADDLGKPFRTIVKHINVLKKNDPSLDESLSVTFIVQYVNRNLQVDLNTQILVHTNVLKSTLGSLLF